MRYNRGHIIWVASVAAVGCAPGDDMPVSDVVVTDSSGVVLVEVGPLAGVPAPDWELDRVYTTARSGVELFHVSAGRIVDGGRIVVGDRGNSVLLILDDDGAVEERLGRDGDGPGEFRSITGVHEDADGGFSVYDTRQGRWTRYDRDAALIGTEAMLPPTAIVDLKPLAVDPAGPLLAIYGALRRFGRDGIQRDTTPLLRYVAVDASPDTVGFWPVAEWSYSETAMGWARTYVGFGRNLAAFGRGGLAAIGDTDSLDVMLIDARGRERMRVRGGGPPITVTEAEGEAWRKRTVSGVGEGLPESLRERFRQAPYRETYPAFDALAVGAEGRLWIGATATFDATERFWVAIESDGSPAGRVTMPEGATVLDIAEGHVLLLEGDDLDVQSVALYRVEER